MSIIERKLIQAEIFCHNNEPKLALNILNEVISDSVSTDMK